MAENVVDTVIKKTEVQLFISKHRGDMSPSMVVWMKGFDTLKSAWQSCTNPSYMIQMLYLENLYYNYETGLLVASCNALSHCVELIQSRQVVSLTKETTCLIATVISKGNRNTMADLRDNIYNKSMLLLNNRKAKLSSMDRDLCRLLYYIVPLTNESIVFAMRVADWSCRWVSYFGPMPIELASDLKILLGNPFERSYE